MFCRSWFGDTGLFWLKTDFNASYCCIQMYEIIACQRHYQPRLLSLKFQILDEIFKFGHHLLPLESVANMSIKWCHLHELQICPPGGATCIGYKLGL